MSDLKELFTTLSNIVELTKRAKDLAVTNDNPRAAIIEACATFLYAGRVARGRDEVDERKLWREILARADALGTVAAPAAKPSR